MLHLVKNEYRLNPQTSYLRQTVATNNGPNKSGNIAAECYKILKGARKSQSTKMKMTDV